MRAASGPIQTIAHERPPTAAHERLPAAARLDENLKPIPSEGAVAPLSGRFLADLDELKKKQEEVANQSKLRYSAEGEVAK